MSANPFNPPQVCAHGLAPNEFCSDCDVPSYVPAVMPAPIRCRYFRECNRGATGTVSHPATGAVPTCDRCAERVGATVEPFPDDMEVW